MAESASATAAAPSTAVIDSLLERYLSLLDQYTELRASLGAAQASMFQSLARANFSAPRGVRYGPDFYDQRMQATRRVRINTSPPPSLSFSPPTTAGVGQVTFAVVSTVADEGEEQADAGEDRVKGKGEEGAVGAGAGGGEGGEEVLGSATGDGSGSGKREGGEKERANGDERERGGDDDDEKTSPPFLNRNPLRWFGIVAPAALGQAQQQSLMAVEDLVPKLASISAEMADVEIQVRRARKKRTRAEAAEDKQG